MLTILACINPEPPVDDEDLGAQDMPLDILPDAPPSIEEPSLVRFRSCRGGASVPDRPLEPWRGLTSPLTARGEPSHALHDVLTTRTRDVDILGHVTYGLFGRALDGELVDLYIHDCEGGFALLARGVTNRQGAVRFVLDEQDVPFHGEYDLLMRVAGDGTTAQATLRVLPAGARLVVLDIDDVLTRDRISGFQDRFAELFEPLGVGDYVPEPRAGAVEMTRLRAAQGYELLYLTPRPHDLTQATRDWLDTQGFAPGTLWFADRDDASLSWNTGAYKRGVLQRMLQRGYLVDVAYGASAQDLDAYREAGLTDAALFLIGDGDAGGATSLGEDYLTHNERELDGAPITQPFER